MYPPGSHLAAHLLHGVLADSGLKAVEHSTGLPPRATRTERIPQERERRLPVRARTPIVLAEYDLGLLGMQAQPQSGQPFGDASPQVAGLLLADAVHDDIVAESLERDLRKFPFHPHVESVVGSPRGVSPRGSHGTERDRLQSFRSSHPLHRYARIHAQCAKSSGSLAVSPRHQALNRFQVRSRLYFFRAHRIK